MIEYIAYMALLVLGFGFVVFWHELGHFIAAKMVGIKVEQFAVGFGQALLSWRKGLGVRVGSSIKEYDELVRSGKADQIDETEYRLNWLPLGGYVKMLGQDDLRPNAQAEDPRAYNRKSVAARMFVVSAGVIMNIILAAIGFMVVFLMGFKAPAPVVGAVAPWSPAAQAVRASDGKPAPLQVGDRILTIDGKVQHDFTKVMLSTALSEEGVSIPVTVQRVDGTVETLHVAPARASKNPTDFVAFGIAPPVDLRGLDPKQVKVVDESLVQEMPVRPGDVVVAVNGEPVKAQAKPGDPGEYYKLDRAVQASGGKAVELTVRRHETGVEEVVSVEPTFILEVFGDGPIQMAGMSMRTIVRTVQEESPAHGKLLPGDALVGIQASDELNVSYPTIEQAIRTLGAAADAGLAVTLVVERDGEEKTLEPVIPNLKLATGNYGLGVGLGTDEREAVVGNVIDLSPAAAAGIPEGATLTSINGTEVRTWFQIKEALAAVTPGAPVQIQAVVEGEPRTYELALDASDIRRVAQLYYALPLMGHGMLHEQTTIRETSNPAIAAWWGVTETRDFVFQFYLTLQRMFQGSVSPKNLMGPVGIFDAGTKFASKGMVWLIWFLSMISANLAVVNFLPIPIVDGGLFLFLIIEKIQGRPLSAKTQSIAQVVGLGLLLSVFLLVTYQDIARLLGAA